MRIRTMAATIWVGAIALIAIGAAARPARAGVISVSEIVADFGTYNQRAFPGACQNNPNFACGPTAVLNSLIYLQKTYPKIYGTKLVPDTPNGPRNTLNTLSALMGCCMGTTPQNLLKGKQEFFKRKAPGTTTFAAQFLRANRFGLPTTKGGMVPTLRFLLSQLGQKEDVEAVLGHFQLTTVTVNGRKIQFYKYVGAHAVTVTGASYNDNNNNAKFDKGDTPNCISFIDPWGANTRAADGAVVTCSNLDRLKIPASAGNIVNGNFLDISNYYASVGTVPGNDAKTRTVILGLFAESPKPAKAAVPEPSTLLLLSIPAFVVGLLRRAPGRRVPRTGHAPEIARLQPPIPAG